MFEVKSSFLKKITAAFVMVLSLFIFRVAVVRFTNCFTKKFYVWNIISLMLLLFLAVFAFLSSVTLARSIKFDAAGVYTKYIFLKWKFHPWEEYQDVCLQYPSERWKWIHPEKPPIYFISQGVNKRRLFPNQWPVRNVFLHFFGNIIEIGFKEEIFLTLKEIYPGEVKECRSKKILEEIGRRKSPDVTVKRKLFAMGDLTGEVHQESEYYRQFGGIGYPGVKGETIFMAILSEMLFTFFVVCIFVCGYRAIVGKHLLSGSIVIVPVLLLFGGYPIYDLEFIYTEYRFSSKGICKKSRHLRERIVIWDDIIEVALKYPKGCTPVNRKYCTAICFSIKTNPDSLYYKIKEKNREFQVEYSPEAMEQLKAVCPLEIVDLRNITK